MVIEVDKRQGDEVVDSGFSRRNAGDDPVRNAISRTVVEIALAVSGLRARLTHRLENIWLSNIAMHGPSPIREI